MKRMLGLGIISLLAVGCTDDNVAKLPGRTAGGAGDISARIGDRPCGGETDENLSGEIDGIVDLRWEYEYDERGRDLRSVGHFDDGRVRTLEYGWDNLGHLTQHLEIRPEQRIEYHSIRDTFGSELEWSYVITGDRDVNLRAVNTEFDERGNPTRAIENGGREDYIVTFTYDELGRMTQQKSVHPDGNAEIYDTVYDDEARTVTSVLESPQDDYTATMLQVYDDSNHLLLDQMAGDTAGYPFSYETAHDWVGSRNVKTVQTDNGKVVSSTTFQFDCR